MAANQHAGSLPRALGDAAGWRPALFRLLGEQRIRLERLERLAERQAALIERGDTDGLLALLAERQPLVDELAGLTEEVQPYREAWAEVARALGPVDGERAMREAEWMESAAARLAERDRRDAAMLEARRDALAQEISAMPSARGAVAAYSRGASAIGARFQDREG